MIDDVRMSGLDIAAKMVYLRATHALDLTEAQRMAIFAGMRNTATPYNPLELRDMPTRLLTSQSKPSDITTQDCMGETMNDKMA